MKKSLLGLLLLLIFLTTYSPNFNFTSNYNLNIKKIEIKNNSILKSDEIIEKVNYLYKKNLFFLDNNEIKKNLNQFEFIESFSLKKKYPNILKIFIVEKKPIAILINKKEKFYISDKGGLINFTNAEIFLDLPTVFGNGKYFYNLYNDLQSIQFPIEIIKSFYFFESGRWDLSMHDDKVIKLPVKNYLMSLKNYMELKNNVNFNNHKIFDYRIKDQLILN
tara:strand:- start:14729 stop:15388 length:660 start_codon:yes stop_codon:yes gene_type:complete